MKTVINYKENGVKKKCVIEFTPATGTDLGSLLIDGETIDEGWEWEEEQDAEKGLRDAVEFVINNLIDSGSEIL